MGPLEGIRVVELALVAAGPYAGSLLGTMGAEVIRLEPIGGDLQQSNPPLIKGMGSMYIITNTNKTSIYVDLRSDWGKEVALRAARRADVLIENLRPGVLDRLGLGYEAIAETNPRIVYCSLRPFGDKGPLANFPAYDHIIQAFTGFGSIQGRLGSQAELLRYIAYIDFTSGMLAAQAITMALRAREITGVGQKINLTMLGASIGLQISRIAEYSATGAQPKPMGSADPNVVPSQAFKALDGKYVTVSVPREEYWPRLCQALQTLGVEDLEADARFATNAQRVEHREELIRILKGIFAEYPARWWLTLLRRHDVPCGPINDYELVCLDPHMKAEGMVIDMETPWGTVKAPGTHWQFSETPTMRRSVPVPDAEREKVLSEIGVVDYAKGDSSEVAS